MHYLYSAIAAFTTAFAAFLAFAALGSGLDFKLVALFALHCGVFARVTAQWNKP